MTDFTLRSDSVDVEQIMRQIRLRIKEKRGADYTEEEVRELASVKLEKFLNPRAIRSDLVEHYRRQRPAVPLPADNYGFEESTIYESHRAPVQWIRKLLNPLLKLLFNPNPLIHVLHMQSRINERVESRFIRRDELDALNFEVLNNIVLELTRATIEVKNLRMRLEAMAARQEFNERRARAFEGLVKPAPGDATAAPGAEAAGSPEPEDGEGRRRRRRRRGRRPRVEPGTPAASGRPDVSAREGQDSRGSGDRSNDGGPGDEPPSEPDTDQ